MLYLFGMCQFLLIIETNDGKSFDTVDQNFCLFSAQSAFDYLLIKYR